jgi:hypothetical protein
MTSRRALWGLIGITSLLRLAFAASLGAGNDEAYHYLFTVHRDWSYFDHPPMLALVETLGLALAGGVASPWSLRLGFIVLFAGSTWLMARLSARFFGPRAGFLAAFALNVSAYHTAAAGTFALPDGPLLFFWLLTVDRLAAALASEPSGGLRPWVEVGLAWGGAMLSKYHAAFLPVGTLLYLLLAPSARPWLRQPGPYLACVLGLIVFAPVIAWNAAHGWASFTFQASRAMGPIRFRPETLAGAILGQAAYLFPWIWIPLLAVLFRRGRGLRVSGAAADWFLLCLSVPPLVVFLVVACMRPVLPHWTLVGFLTLFPMLGQAWADLLEANPIRFARRLAIYAALPIAVAAIAVLQARSGLFQKGGHGPVGLLRVSRDPTVDMFGWDQIAHELDRRGLLGQPRSFVFTGSWYHSGQLGFATRRSTTPVLCYNSLDARSFAFWSRPADWVGWDGILVAVNERLTEPSCFQNWFTRIEPIGSFEVVRGGVPVRKVRLFRCVRQSRAFPFQGTAPAEVDRRIAATRRRD